MELGRPLLYFVAVSPGLYDPVFPCYVVGDSPPQLAFHLMADARRDPSAAIEDPQLNIPLKAYATRTRLSSMRPTSYLIGMSVEFRRSRTDSRCAVSITQRLTGTFSGFGQI